MIYATKGIVLHHFDYSESSIIVKIYTELYGLQSFIIKGFKNNKSRYKKALIQPLSIVEVVAYPNPKGEIHLIKEMVLYYHPKTLYLNIKKTAIVFFLNEIIYKSIKEQEPNQLLFRFILDSLIYLDDNTEKISNFNLFFIIQFTKYLGFFPEQNYSENCAFFNLIDGIYQPSIPNHNNYIDSYLAKTFFELSNESVESLHKLKISYNDRKILLIKICNYYEIHISGFKNLKTIEVLEKIFEE